MTVRDRCRATYDRAFPPGQARIKRLAAFALSMLVLYLLVENVALNHEAAHRGDQLISTQQEELAREDALLTAISLLEQQVRDLCAHRPSGAPKCAPVTVPHLTPLPGQTFAPSQGSGGGAVRGGGSTPTAGGTHQPDGGGPSSSPQPRPSSHSPRPSPRPSPTHTRPPLVCVGGVCLPNPLPTLGASDAGRVGVLDERPKDVAVISASVPDRHGRDPGTGAGGYAALGIGIVVLGLIRSTQRPRTRLRRRPPS